MYIHTIQHNTSREYSARYASITRRQHARAIIVHSTYPQFASALPRFHTLDSPMPRYLIYLRSYTPSSLSLVHFLRATTEVSTYLLYPCL